MEPLHLGLKKNETIGIIAPAGNTRDPAAYQRGINILKRFEFEVVPESKKWPGEDFLSDSDEARARELMAMWRNPEIKAIMALRGGYGSLRILERLDFETIRSFPKLFIGFSDITILLNVLVQNADQICIHGPVVSSLSSCDNATIDRLHHCLRGNYHRALKEDLEIVRAAPPVQGVLLGGNLSSLATLIGTPWDIDYSGSILFLEDVNEPPYRLDRLLTQFSLANKWHGVKGIILGGFSDSFNVDLIERQRIEESVWKRVLELVEDPEIPVWGRFPGGHASRNIALPLGMRAEMNSDTFQLRFTPSQR